VAGRVGHRRRVLVAGPRLAGGVARTLPSRRLATAAAVPCALLGLAGCARTIKESDMESKISGNIAGQLKGTKVQVNCPVGKKAEKGETFTCSAKIDGKPAAIDVRLLDDKGRFSFTVRSSGDAKP
jgi:hypothetical protein